MRVHKYKLKTNESNAIFIDFPKGGKPLSVQLQFGELMLWALVDPTAETTRREVFFYPTGEDIPAVAVHYIGTVQMYSGKIVGHVFIDEEHS